MLSWKNEEESLSFSFHSFLYSNFKMNDFPQLTLIVWSLSHFQSPLLSSINLGCQ